MSIQSIQLRNIIVQEVQIFSNEHCKPSDKVLIDISKIIDDYYLIGNIRSILDFINCQTFFIGDTPNKNVDITVFYDNLPFEDHSFDCILSFNNGYEYEYIYEFNRVLKPEGKIISY